MPAAIPSRWRKPICLLLLAAVYGLSVLWCGSLFDAVYLASVPGFLVWAVISQPKARLRPSRRHLVYFGALGAMVVGYMVGYARITPSVTVRWGEVAAPKNQGRLSPEETMGYGRGETCPHMFGRSERMTPMSHAGRESHPSHRPAEKTGHMHDQVRQAAGPYSPPA